MTNNENDVDIDPQEEFDREPVEKASLKETWDSNPMLKIAAVIIGIAVIGGLYYTFAGGEEKNNHSVVATPSTAAKNIPGQNQVDTEYKQKIEEVNKKNAADASHTGTSSMPIPLGTGSDTGLTVPPAPAAQTADPLAEWRDRAEKRRQQIETSAPPPEENEAPPEVVPVVTPIRPQPQQKMDPNAAKLLAEQMRAIILSQVPKQASRIRVTTKLSAYDAKLVSDKEKATAAATNAAGSAAGTDLSGKSVSADGTPKAADTKVIVPAGNIAYAQLLNDLNSDIKGPVLAQILSGPFEGARAIGEFARQDEYMTLSFKRLVKDGVTYSINGIALDENTTLAANQTDVDHHYFQRIILPAAAQFLTGYTQAAAQTTQTATPVGDSTEVTSPAPDTRQEIMQGATQAASNISSILTQDQGRPVTVYVARGTTLGILFMDTVTTASATK